MSGHPLPHLLPHWERELPGFPPTQPGSRLPGKQCALLPGDPEGWGYSARTSPKATHLLVTGRHGTGSSLGRKDHVCRHFCLQKETRKLPSHSEASAGGPLCEKEGSGSMSEVSGPGTHGNSGAALLGNELSSRMDITSECGPDRP